jgi:hypothetical protein
MACSFLRAKEVAMKGKAALMAKPAEDDLDVRHLMEWAEINGGRHLAEDTEDEPCECDILDDRVGLPSGTAGEQVSEDEDLTQDDAQ